MKRTLLLLADTHLGLDEPVRPRVQRRRRGPDFFANFERVLEHARRTRPDLVVHGGDLFFRSRVPTAIVDRVYERLLAFAEEGIPLAIVPGNHERSRLPGSLFLAHPRIHVFSRPETFCFGEEGARIALAGIPNVREDVRGRFPALVEASGWREHAAELRFLCIHQAVDGARVGPADFEFRGQRDVVAMDDLPAGLHAVLSGHIHRAQILRGNGRTPPVIYPGSTERTSFAEKDEPKGFCELTARRDALGVWALDEPRFVPLPARPMCDLLVPADIASERLESYLRRALQALDPDAIVRVRCAPGTASTTEAKVSERLLRELAPATMNFHVSSRR